MQHEFWLKKGTKVIAVWNILFPVGQSFLWRRQFWKVSCVEYASNMCHYLLQHAQQGNIIWHYIYGNIILNTIWPLYKTIPWAGECKKANMMLQSKHSHFYSLCNVTSAKNNHFLNQIAVGNWRKTPIYFDTTGMNYILSHTSNI